MQNDIMVILKFAINRKNAKEVFKLPMFLVMGFNCAPSPNS